MKSQRRYTQGINTGSMADIAFLLLIFFLVTTTISADKGILRQLPAECPPNQNCENTVKDQNLFRLVINDKSQLMVNDEELKIELLKDAIKSFIDNNGSENCSYCNGSSSKKSSEHPKIAFISFQFSPKTKYDSYIQVQNIISKAFYELRSEYAETVLKKSVNELSKEELNLIKKAYPFNLHEIKNFN